jgi:transmembrane 9 superfamily protein 2/4
MVLNSPFLLFALMVSFTLNIVLKNYATAFYLPGLAPHNFAPGENVDLKVVKLTSVRAQLPFSYYSLPVCKPTTLEDAAENLGEVLSGDVIQNSVYEIKMMEPLPCTELCTTTLDGKSRSLFREKIQNKYVVHWLIDNLPAAMKVTYGGNPDGNNNNNNDESGDASQQEEYYEVGFPVGVEVAGTQDPNQRLYYLYNHVSLKIYVHSNPAVFDGYRVVRFEVEPFSVKHKRDKDGKLTTCTPTLKITDDMTPQAVGANTEKEDDRKEDVVWTYDVEWIQSDIPWASRWDVFFNRAPEDTIHWFSIVNSLMIVVFLTGMVAMILMRTLHKDIARYNAQAGAQAGGDLSAAGLVLVDPEDAQEETGWKLVHGDVFRPPTTSPMLLAVLAGTGIQILASAFILIVFACFGFLSPANRGGFETAMLLLFVMCASFAGYWSARLYKMFGGKMWRRNTLLTAFLFPGVIFTIFFIVNLFVWGAGSSGAVPILAMLALLVLWLGISVPLAFVGSYVGFKSEEIKNPVRYNQIPRSIPEQAWFMHPIFSILIGGILPFGAVFIELFFIMSSVWTNQIYYVFGFSLLVLLILIVTCTEIVVVLTYFSLCSEDYRWWWRSFLTSGSSALYLFLYSILYYVSKLNFTRYEAAVQYFMYMIGVTFTFFLMTGAIGFFSTFAFVRTIYGAIKID